MKLLRVLTGVAAVVVALVLQVSLFPHFAWHGIVPNLVLLVVVGRRADPRRVVRRCCSASSAASPSTSRRPPTTSPAGGRWPWSSSAYVAVAGPHRQPPVHRRRSSAPSPPSSFVGTSVFALSGVLLRDPVMSVPDLLQVILVALVWDVLLTPFVLPLMMRMFQAVAPRAGHRLMAVSGAQKSRLRLFVVQALVFSLFATLFVRLYYLQVVGGESYQAKAADQSVRDIVVQPQRGLIVDDQGRPLVANRMSWVVSVDRTLVDKLAADEREQLLTRVGEVVGQDGDEIAGRLDRLR